MTRPWELPVGTRPWEIQQPVYPRVITIRRPNSITASGLVAYSGDVETDETVIASGLSANIAIAASGRNTSSSGLPSDSAGPIKWTVTLPAAVLPTLPEIMERDVVYDDLGRRFQISAFQPEPIGARLDTVRLMA